MFLEEEVDRSATSILAEINQVNKASIGATFCSLPYSIPNALSLSATLLLYTTNYCTICL
jgi:hypothetical protein